MARINLLPWREERRKQRQQEFFVILGGAAVFGLLAVFGVHSYIVSLQNHQEARNVLLRTEIAKLDERIKDIEELDRERERILARKQIIEELQKSRSLVVRLFDQIVRTVPDGVRLTSIEQQGLRLTAEGLADSSAKVSAYMRSLEASDWMKNAELSILESAGEGRAQRYDFSVSVLVGPENGEGELADEEFGG